MCFSAAYQGLPTDLGGLFHYEPLSQSYMRGAKLVVSSNQWAERGGGVKIHVHELLCERPSSEQGTFPFFPTKMSMFSRKWLVYASGFSFARPQFRYALRWSTSSLRQARRPGRRTVTWAAKAAVVQRATYLRRYSNHSPQIISTYYCFCHSCDAGSKNFKDQHSICR